MEQGKTLILSLNGTALGCVTDIDINFTQQFISTRDVVNVGWLTQIPEQKSGTISGSGLVVFEGRDVWYLNGFDTPTLVTWRYGTSDNANGFWTGSAWIQTYGESSQGSGFLIYNYSLVIDGRPTFTPGVTTGGGGGIGAMAIGSTFIVS